MKTLSLIILLIISAYSQSDTESAKSSVVKIKTTYIKGNKKLIGTATGWCWKKPNYIITALHAVAGMNNIRVYRNKDEVSYANAKILKIIKEADLALLKLDKSLDLIPLETIPVDPNSRETFYIWGFPHSVYSMGGDEIRFSRSLDKKPTLSDLLTGNALKLKLSQQGYPLPTASIFRISSTIQPGHSGAPILNKYGKVLAIADGGLRGGTARLNWAIPAHMYLNNLLYSRDPIPISPSLQTSLYSKLTEIPIAVAEEEEKIFISKSEKTVKGNNVLVTKTWTGNYIDILILLIRTCRKIYLS